MAELLLMSKYIYFVEAIGIFFYFFRCTNPLWYGCIRTGTSNNVLNPIKSARLRTLRSFSFKYGRVVARARMPAGDWLWPGRLSSI